MAMGKSLTGPFGELSRALSANFREAPMLIARPDGQGWYLYSEQYPGMSYSLATATSLHGPWHEVYWQDYATPPKARHGGMIELRKTEWEALVNEFGNR